MHHIHETGTLKGLKSPLAGPKTGPLAF